MSNLVLNLVRHKPSALFVPQMHPEPRKLRLKMDHGKDGARGI